MTRFDPAAATAAWLAQMTPAAQAKAVAYTQGGHWLLLWGSIVDVAASLIILKIHLLPSLARGLQTRRPRPVVVSLVAAAVFFALSWLIRLPWSIYADWWRERSYGMTSQAFGGWMGEQALAAAINIVATAVFFTILYAVIRRAPRFWWAWAGLAASAFFLFALVLGPVLVEPLFNHYAPAPQGPVRDQVVALAKVSGVPSDKIFIYDGSKQSNRYTANVSGLFGSARVAMSDEMFKQGADLAEVRGVVGHEMGHYAHQHALWFAAAFSVLAALGLWLADRLFSPIQRWVAAAEVAGIADPAGLPILVIAITVLGLFATPIVNTMTRTAEADADRFSLTHAHEPDGLAKALIKTAPYRAATPGWLEEVIFYDHPSVGRRIRTAMDWKAANPGAAPAR